jgi:hypothetical protein
MSGGVQPEKELEDLLSERGSKAEGKQSFYAAGTLTLCKDVKSEMRHKRFTD